MLFNTLIKPLTGLDNVATNPVKGPLINPTVLAISSSFEGSFASSPICLLSM